MKMVGSCKLNSIYETKHARLAQRKYTYIQVLEHLSFRQNILSTYLSLQECGNTRTNKTAMKKSMIVNEL